MKVTCFDRNNVAIGVVEYTDNLDHWNGNNWTSGRTGRHLGIGRTADGRFYVCYGTEWQGERNRAEIISENKAKELCLRHDSEMYEDLFGEDLPNLSQKEDL